MMKLVFVTQFWVSLVCGGSVSHSGHSASGSGGLRRRHPEPKNDTAPHPRQLVSQGQFQQMMQHNAAPLGDSIANRDGELVHLGIPSAWGEKPYPISKAADGPFNGAISPPVGSIYNTDSDDGHRIRKQLLDAHNYVRKLEAPNAQFMSKLIYDYHLEAYATQWVEYLCANPQSSYFDHSPDRSTGLPAWPWRIATGENLYTSSGARPASDDFSDVVMKWFAERDYYDWNTGEAAASHAGQPVGHWKQLVRPQATAVGCAVASNCHSGGQWKTFVGCQYDYGNLGKDPYPAAEGPVCSKCPQGLDGCCEDGLCSGAFSLESTDLGEQGPAAEVKTGWYACTNWQRPDCAQTGAASYSSTVQGDAYNLEFLQCNCGLGPSFASTLDTVSKGYFWFRNRCFKAEADGSASDPQAAQGQSIYRRLLASPPDQDEAHAEALGDQQVTNKTIRYSDLQPFNEQQTQIIATLIQSEKEGGTLGNRHLTWQYSNLDRLMINRPPPTYKGASATTDHGKLLLL